MLGSVWENWPLINWIGAITVLLEHGKHIQFMHCSVETRCILKGKGLGEHLHEGGNSRLRGFLGEEERVEMKSNRATFMIWGMLFR